jgi:hypothetical protein
MIATNLETTLEINKRIKKQVDFLNSKVLKEGEKKRSKKIKIKKPKMKKAIIIIAVFGTLFLQGYYEKYKPVGSAYYEGVGKNNRKTPDEVKTYLKENYGEIKGEIESGELLNPTNRKDTGKKFIY